MVVEVNRLASMGSCCDPGCCRGHACVDTIVVVAAVAVAEAVEAMDLVPWTWSWRP